MHQQLLELVRKSNVKHIPHSRVHPLKTFDSCKVKRDDELGFGVSGSKLRKYSSLIPHLIKNSVQEAVVIGSAYSNHVLSVSQLLIENRIKPTLFLLGEPSTDRRGNLLLTSLLVPESQQHWISRNDWPQVEALAANYAQGKSAMVIPEGACMDASLPGALTLALDLLANELEEGHAFDHIFIDAGTGLIAIATILAFSWLRKNTVLHILLLAGDRASFLEKLKQFQTTFESLTATQLHWEKILEQFILYQPSQARAFGSINKTILNHIGFLAREEGFFTDPIYSAKLFWEAKKISSEKALSGNILVIHSGGALTLMGFQDQLDHLLSLT